MADTPDTSAPRTRGELQEIDDATCWELLETADAGRVVHMVADRPHIAVVNIAVDDGSVVVRCSPGSRLATALSQPGAPVLVQADHLDAATRSGWSVVARGRMTAVLDQVTVAHLDRTAQPSWILGDSGGTWLRLEVDEISGRRVGRGAERAPSE